MTDLQFSIFVIRPAARLQLFDPPEDTASRCPPGAKQDQLADSLLIHLCPDRRVCKDGFHLRRKQQSTFVEFIKQRLYADPVPGKEQPVLLLFPNRKGKNAVEFIDTGFSPLGITVQYHFRIRMPLEDMPQRLQLPANRIGIIEFSVIHDFKMFSHIVAGHRLAAACRIDHREPCVKQCTVPAGIIPLSIRAPADHCFKHFITNRPGAFQIDKTRNSAHRSITILSDGNILCSPLILVPV